MKIYSLIQHLLKLADLQSIKEQRLNNLVNFQLSIMKKLWDIAQENLVYIKFIYSEKATKFCEISTLDLSYVVSVKSKVAFSEYMNFNVLQPDFFFVPKAELAKSHTGLLAHFSYYISGFLDHVTALTLPQVRQIMDILSILAYNSPKVGQVLR